MRKIEDILLYCHLDEMEREKAKGWNIGWYSSETRIESKTDMGILVSRINRKTKRVCHDWFARPTYARLRAWHRTLRFHVLLLTRKIRLNRSE